MRIVNVSGEDPCEDPYAFYAILSEKELNTVTLYQQLYLTSACFETEEGAIKACIEDGPERADHYIARIEIVAKTV